MNKLDTSQVGAKLAAGKSATAHAFQGQTNYWSRRLGAIAQIEGEPWGVPVIDREGGQADLRRSGR